MQANSTGIRGKIISPHPSQGMLTLQELQRALGCDLRKTRDNIRAAAADRLVVLDSDEVTGQPGYKLTDKRSGGSPALGSAHRRRAAGYSRDQKDAPDFGRTDRRMCGGRWIRKKHLQRKSFLRRSLQRLQSQNTCFFWWCPIDRSISGHSLGTFPEAKAHAIKNSREAVAEGHAMPCRKLGHTSLIAISFSRDAE